MTKPSPLLAAGDVAWAFPEGPKVYVFDTETNGLLDEATKLHSLVIRDFRSGELVLSWGSGRDEVCFGTNAAASVLDGADYLVAHNGYKFDFPILRKLCGWKPRDGQILIDTLPMCRLIYSFLDDLDSSLVKTGKLPGNLFRSHSLQAWGIRLGQWKGDYSDVMKERGLDPWEKWSEEMQEYCEQDTVVNVALLQRLLSRPYSARAVDLELEVAQICAQMEFNGFPFDEAQGASLFAELSGIRAKVERELLDQFGSWWEGGSETTPARPRRVFTAHDEGVPVNRGSKKTPVLLRGFYTAYADDAPYTPITRVAFNPASRAQIAKRLIQVRGWSPTEFTDSGQPKVDESVLKTLPWPEAKALARFFLVDKRVGQLANGNQAWLKVVRGGRIHGSINPNGAVTGRATHSYPNVAQVPSVKVKETKRGDGSTDKEVLWGEPGEWGADCRALFTAPKGHTLIGADLSKLELLCLAHYLGRYDKGRYTQIVLSGDPHVDMQNNAGVDTRSKGKTLNYCLIYGGGDVKLGLTADPLLDNAAARARGRQIRSRIMSRFTGYADLVRGCQSASKRGFMFGLDGRRVHVRSEHSALNTLLQGAGALIAKRWMVELDQMLHTWGWTHGVDWSLHAWLHDELQFSVRPQDVERAKEAAIEAASRAGKWFNLRVPILAEAKHGSTWQATH